MAAVEMQSTASHLRAKGSFCGSSAGSRTTSYLLECKELVGITVKDHVVLRSGFSPGWWSEPWSECLTIIGRE